MISKSRKTKTDFSSQLFTQITLDAMWAKAEIDSKYHPKEYRCRRCGTFHRLHDFGNKKLQWGGEIITLNLFLIKTLTTSSTCSPFRDENMISK